ncbi:unnamed protein product [Vicia faba]|uniref:Uncharacterized protein n=1 Tax=Vicia faba TaxID=3906 RepID=A0AAV0ZNT1_VICFA|nr:unnamed protein product [Vicia faba]
MFSFSRTPPEAVLTAKILPELRKTAPSELLPHPKPKFAKGIYTNDPKSLGLKGEDPNPKFQKRRNQQTKHTEMIYMMIVKMKLLRKRRIREEDEQNRSSTLKVLLSVNVQVGASKGLHGLIFDITITYWSKFFVTSMIAQQAWSPCTSGSGTLVNVADYLTMIVFHDVNDENF